MFDRILLLLLILLLPLGILASRAITGEVSFGGGQSTQLQEQQITELVQKLTQNTAAVPSQTVAGADFTITAVLLATETGRLKIVGMAPQNQELLWVWTASTDSKQKKSLAASASAQPIWDGPLVIQPQVGGLFTVEVDVSVMAGVVEVRLEQGKSTSLVRFDLVRKVQLQNSN